MSGISIGGIPASLRTGAERLGLLCAAQKLVPPGARTELADIGEFPALDPDADTNPPEGVRRFQPKVRPTDAVLFSLNEPLYASRPRSRTRTTGGRDRTRR